MPGSTSNFLPSLRSVFEVIARPQSEATKAGAAANGNTLQEIVLIFVMGDKSLNQPISTILNILADTAAASPENLELK